MHKAFQTFLGFLFAATFAATVALQGNLTDVDPTSYWNMTYWEKASRTGYGYLAFYLSGCHMHSDQGSVLAGFSDAQGPIERHGRAGKIAAAAASGLTAVISAQSRTF